jgi:SNF2 family DNA or RNA helicase
LPTNVSLEWEESDEYSVSLVALLATIEDLKERFDADEEQRALVMEMLELTFIKEFSYKFEEWESHLLQIIEKFKHNATVRQMLSEVLSTFKDIQGRQYEWMRTDNGRAPMFFQKYGVYRIEQLRYERKLPGVILAFEPGLGKTITALLAINGDETTVLCPNSVVSWWKEEAAKFFEHKSLELVYAMNMRRRVAEIESSNKWIIVTNYQTLQQIKNESLFRAINN